MDTYSIQITALDNQAASQIYQLLEDLENDGELEAEFERITLLSPHGKQISSFEPCEKDYILSLHCTVKAKSEADAYEKALEIESLDDFYNVETEYAELSY